ncbi:bifunctional enoyl-CoA hydratase/phosphate acetyltransferase [Thioflexithrix psekupsensis]|uniref:Enoyl-CoA hydratase n=1 Tax=Thioflexithrix psekupsensis TaxID=1570016 RepID=A0A251X4U7_9GAMM|nr:bifunctional enoyl-CoA hydratase/phosphate acetyltransferase [Thioflexithrix psekupsensis]OUD11739.1 enoyl-CoA hydratase [Thioflexithrix psekupsensis]
MSANKAVESSNYLENKTFDEINIGDTACLTRTLTFEDISLFAMASGDVNPTHLDLEYASSTGSGKVSGHSLWQGALISNILGTQLPGPGTVYRRQDLQFSRPILLSDTLTVTITVSCKNDQDHTVIFDCIAVDQAGEVTCRGTAEVYAPMEKIIRERSALPEIHINNPGAQLQRLVKMTEHFEPIRMAVVHPVDRNSLLGAIEACQARLIVPVLFGPRDKIVAVAKQEGVDVSGYEIIDTEHSHEAAEKAVAMARSGEVDALMKGSLHTDELMGAAVRTATGIKTARRMSHVFVIDVPHYPRPILVSDAAINIAPTLQEKADIVQNAIDLAHALGIQQPLVAMLSAVETINPKLNSTLDAAAICKMAHRRQITGGIVDGPLAFDNAVSEEAARIKGIDSPVAGRADILISPDLESGNMVAKQLEYMAEAQSCGIVLGARVPIALTSRADSVLSRMASCALALLLVRNLKKPMV